jgi:hypothetical protein
MTLYAYCLSDEVSMSAFESVVGMAGAQPRLICLREIKAVVSDFNERPVAVTRENVLAHERVVRQVLVRATPLPFRFGTLVSKTQLENYLDLQYDSLKRQLEQVRGCVEMSVKVIWNLEAVRQEAVGPDEQGRAKASAALKSGTAFLAAKRREILGDEALKKRAAELADWLSSGLGDTVRETRLTVQPQESLVMAAAHLVERARLKEYRAALQRVRAERGELHFLTSGAWPPYSFSSISS